jgi:hypothetical protein
MARAYNIWIVTDEVDNRVVRAFTVKHELVTYLKGMPHPDWRYHSVTRLPDGNLEVPPKWFAIAELLA